MSQVYIKEPSTNGKVILKTTLGDFDCELWSREAPKACRNFVQLCMEGYYNGTIFHRVLKGFIAQGGDPTGTGFGGESIYGESFKDEFHSRLRFVRRGLLAMANAEKDSNGSQFFFTLGACPELQDKHTIFGKVAGDTIYNMIKFDELQIDQNDRPLYPPKILSTEIVYNPFDDIVPRKTETKKVTRKEEERPKVKGTKDFKLLSFGDEAEEEEETVYQVTKGFKGKSKSSHDLLNDPKLSSIPVVEPSLVAINNHRLKGDIEDKMTDEDASDTSDDDGSNSIKKRKLEFISKLRSTFISFNNPFGEGTSKDFLDEPMEDDLLDNLKEDKQLRLQMLKWESKKLKKSLLKKKEVEEIKPSQSTKQLDPHVADHKNEIIKLKMESMTNKKSNAELTFAKLEKFREKSRQLKANQLSGNSNNGDSMGTIKSDSPLSTLITHKMISEESEPVLAKDANLIKEADWFDIHDPRHPVNKRRREPGNETATIKKSNNHNNNNRH